MCLVQLEKQRAAPDHQFDNSIVAYITNYKKSGISNNPAKNNYRMQNKQHQKKAKTLLHDIRLYEAWLIPKSKVFKRHGLVIICI
jgi:hypothetical protein